MLIDESEKNEGAFVIRQNLLQLCVKYIQTANEPKPM